MPVGKQGKEGNQGSGGAHQGQPQGQTPPAAGPVSLKSFPEIPTRPENRETKQGNGGAASREEAPPATPVFPGFPGFPEPLPPPRLLRRTRRPTRRRPPRGGYGGRCERPGAPEAPGLPGLPADDVPALLARLASRDVRVTVGGDGATLTVDAPDGDGALCDEEWALLAAVKPLLLAYLAPPRRRGPRNRPSGPNRASPWGRWWSPPTSGLSTPPREVAGVAYEPRGGAWRYRLAGEPFTRAESELRPAPPEGLPPGAPEDPSTKPSTKRGVPMMTTDTSPTSPTTPAPGGGTGARRRPAHEPPAATDEAVTGVVDRTNDNGLHLEGGPWLNYTQVRRRAPPRGGGDAVRVTVRDGKSGPQARAAGGAGFPALREPPGDGPPS